MVRATVIQWDAVSADRSVHRSTSSIGITRTWPRLSGRMSTMATQTMSRQMVRPGISPLMIRVKIELTWRSLWYLGRLSAADGRIVGCSAWTGIATLRR